MAEVKHIKADELKPDLHNANTGTERGRYALEASLRQYGAARSIVVDKMGRIIAGNKTLETAVDVGLDDVLVVQTDGTQVVAVQRMDLDLAQDDDARMLAYADNRVGELDLEWDIEALQTDIAAGLPLDNFWQDWELDEMFDDGDPPGAGEDTEPQTDRADELRQKWQTEAGQLWRLPSAHGDNEHRLICGDCTDADVVARVMGGERVNAVVTDPPYGGNYDIDYTRFSGGLSQSSDFGTGIIGDDEPFDPSRLLDFDEVILWGGNLFAASLPVGSWLVWDKRYEGQDKILSDGEIAWKKSGIGVYIFNHGWNGFLRESERGKTLHPTQKPSALFEWCMGMIKSEIIFDPYSGSGTAIIAAENLARQCRAVEISPAYCAVILERYHDHTGLMPELIEA